MNVTAEGPDGDDAILADAKGVQLFLGAKGQKKWNGWVRVAKMASLPE
jgi:hypothetical protein